MSVRALIITQFEQVAKEHKNNLAPLTDDMVLLECGLDSLCFAVIAARLEDELGFDPFNDAENIEYPVTFGEFVRLYEDAAK
jgi:acyl carrier protein